MGSIGGVTAKVAGRGILKSRSLEPPRAIGLERLMKIAQVAPLYESVPPKYYGGTERVVSYLTEELVRLGHDVTLFASGDSETAARLVPVTPRSLRLDERCVDQLAHHVLLLERVSRAAAEFDVVHYHIDYLHFPLSRSRPHPHVTTLHGRLDMPDLAPLYEEFREMPVVSISNSQRQPLPWANWQATVYHGLPPDLLRFHPEQGRYLAFIGRFSPEKGADQAIEIAKRARIPLKLAAKVDRVDEEYFEREIKPLLSDPLLEYVGEIGEAEKNDFLGQAYALLFPIDWPEPFGLVMIEAMACGTPIIAYRQGSVEEVMEEGRSGFIVQDLEDAVHAVGQVADIDRAEVRSVFERRFTATQMATDYVRVYQRIIAQQHRHAA
jgi:glycosyltransferase involved in cell wall biosynthesis